MTHSRDGNTQSEHRESMSLELAPIIRVKTDKEHFSILVMSPILVMTLFGMSAGSEKPS